MKRRFRWPSRREGRDAHPSPQPTTVPLPERTKPLASAANSQSLNTRTTNVDHTANTSAQKFQDSTPRDGTSSGGNAAKKDYWQLAADLLQQEDSSTADQIAGVQKAAATTGNTDFAAQLLHTTQQSQQELESKRWKVSVSSRDIVLRDQFERLVRAVTLFKDVANAARNIDPLHAGLPLAGFCVLMQIATNDSEQYAAMVAGVEEIVTIVARYSQIEALYLSRPKTILKQEFERHLLNLYKHIIRYQISATCYYRRNTMLRFIRAFPKLDDVSQLMVAIRRDDTACRDIGQVFDSSDALERHQELLEKLDRFEKYLMKHKDPSHLPSTSHVHWTVTRSTNTMFTGRDQLLSELETVARHSVTNPSRQDQCRVVITGMGGQGKSEICLQLAHRVRYEFWGVFWVDVSTTHLAESAFLDIASRMQIPAQSWEDGRQGLANTQHPWMLVLDNADDPSVDYQRYIPAGLLGMVILTSRNEQCKQYATEKYLPLDRLSDTAACDLLIRAADESRDQCQTLRQDAQVVASLLQSHPLALVLAGSYISRGHCTMAQYPGVFTQHRQRLLTFELRQAQPRYKHVYATFEASANILQSLNTEAAVDALQLLPVLAACAPGRLPLLLFEAGWKGAQSISSSEGDEDDVAQLTQWHVARLLPLMQSDADTWDSFRLIEAITLLKSLSLVSTDINSGFLSVSMHPLTHAWARDRQELAEQHGSWVTTGCLVALSYLDDIWLRYRRQLQPHVQALTTWEISMIFTSEPAIMITSILMKCGRLLYNMRDNAKVFVLMERMLAHLGSDRWTVDRRWLGLYELTAWNLIDYGKSKEAVSLLEQVVKIRKQTLTEDHPYRLASQHALAIAYQANGQVSKAVLLLEQVVKIEEQTLAEDHPDRLTSQHELAGVYRANGQVSKAVLLLEQVVKIQEQTLAEDHPDRLASQHTLAIAYQASGQISKAVSLLEQVVKVEEQTLAEDHPSRLISQQVLATMYWDLGRRNAALQMTKHVVEICQQVLDENHPTRTASEEWLEFLKREMDNLETG